MANYNKTLRFTPGTPLFSPTAVPPKAVLTWIETEGGKRRPNGPQAVDMNGVPLWVATMTMTSENFGEAQLELVDIVFPSKETPRTLPADLFAQAR